MMYQLQGYGYASSNALGILIPPIIRTLTILAHSTSISHPPTRIYIYIYIYIYMMMMMMIGIYVDTQIILYS